MMYSDPGARCSDDGDDDEEVDDDEIALAGGA
jgi:hypothetical protein